MFREDMNSCIVVKFGENQPLGRLSTGQKTLSEPPFCLHFTNAPRIPWTLSPLDLCMYIPNLVRIGCSFPKIFQKNM